MRQRECRDQPRSLPSGVKAEADKLKEEKGYTLADIFEAGVEALKER